MTRKKWALALSLAGAAFSASAQDRLELHCEFFDIFKIKTPEELTIGLSRRINETAARLKAGIKSISISERSGSLCIAAILSVPEAPAPAAPPPYASGVEVDG